MLKGLIRQEDIIKSLKKKNNMIISTDAERHLTKSNTHL